MKHFYSADSVNDVQSLVKDAIQMKHSDSLDLKNLAGKKMLMIFFNPSLRTRLSTEYAAKELGLHTISMNATEGWKWEIEPGVIMNLDKAEHIKDAARVVSEYVDIVAIRSFPGLKNREEDYRDELIQHFIEYAKVPVINMESSIFHPLQSLTDLMTIEEHRHSMGSSNIALSWARGASIEKQNPKVKPLKIVLSWAPHPRALPQAVSNSFLQWIKHTDHQITITHPEGYDLHESFTDGCHIEMNQSKAFENADIIYTKNWSSYQQYGAILTEDQNWMINKKKMALTNNAKFMHCLPVRRNVVVTDSVMDGDHSIVYQQAGNRLHAAKTVIYKLLNQQHA